MNRPLEAKNTPKASIVKAITVTAISDMVIVAIVFLIVVIMFLFSIN